MDSTMKEGWTDSGGASTGRFFEDLPAHSPSPIVLALAEERQATPTMLNECAGTFYLREQWESLLRSLCRGGRGRHHLRNKPGHDGGHDKETHIQHQWHSAPDLKERPG